MLSTSLKSELQDVKLSVKGEVPSWVDGSLYRNGPALFEIGEDQFQHWFDGQAMLHRFHLQGGCVTYTNKFLQSHNYKAHMAAGRIAVDEFGTVAPSSIFSRLSAMWSAPSPYENNNVSVKVMSGKVVALSETPKVLEVDPALGPVGPVVWNDKLSSAPLSTAHPHTLEDGRFLNYETVLGKDCFYRLYTTPAAAAGVGAPVERTEVARIPSARPAYMHSFGLSPSYYILVEFPWLFQLSKFVGGQASKTLFGSAPETVIDGMYSWEPERGTWFTLCHRESGALRRVRLPEGIFAYHHVNAFEDEQGRVSVDMMCYPDPRYNALTLEKVRSTFFTQLPEFQGGQLRRYIVDLDKETIETKILFDGVCELPTIDYARRNTKPYQFVYGLGYDGQALRVDLHTGETKEWRHSGSWCGEPIFVPRPEGEKEDDGVVLTVVSDPSTGRSSLAVLDAATMEQVAVAETPHHIPMGLHGTFARL